VTVTTPLAIVAEAPIPEVEVIQVVHVRFQRGDGLQTVYRFVDAYFDLEGNKLAEVDPLPGDEAVVDSGPVSLFRTTGTPTELVDAIRKARRTGTPNELVDVIRKASRTGAL
jgi:hypothetical protein